MRGMPFFKPKKGVQFAGQNFSDGDGGGGGSYVLPTATADRLGGVKVGSGVTVQEDGTISVYAYELPTASASTLGGVKIGSGITVQEDGTISVSSAIANKADISGIIATGTTNETGSTITSGTYFYLNGVLVKATANIATQATFTENTNYESAKVGEVLTSLNKKVVAFTVTTHNDVPFDVSTYVDNATNYSWSFSGSSTMVICRGATAVSSSTVSLSMGVWSDPSTAVSEDISVNVLGIRTS